MNEAQICNHLAKNLALLEPGLRLLASEYRLDNPDGAGGRIDILARDAVGNLVVVELKKSNATARAALHEIMKYLALLQRQKGVEGNRIRCMIVSTDWHELRVPFSEMLHGSPFTLEGRLLLLDAQGLPCATSPVRPIPVSEGLQFPTEFPWLTFETSEARDQVARRLVELLPEIGVEHALVVVLTSLRPRGLAFPYSLILVMFPFSTEVANCVLTQTIFPIQLLEDGDVDAFDGFEPAVLAALESKLFCLPGVRDVHLSLCENFAAERATWNVDRILRIGQKLSDGAILEDSDIVEFLIGFSGGNDTRLVRSVRVSHKMQFERVVAQLENLLSRYPGWWQEVSPAIAECRKDPDQVLAVDAYCPDNFFKHFAMFWREGDVQWLPAFEVLLASRDQIRLLRGSVAWDGRSLPGDVDKILPEHGGSNPFRLVAANPEEVDAFIQACGLVFPVSSFSNDRPPSESRASVPLDRLIAADTDKLAELVARLGHIVVFPADPDH